MKKPAWIAIGLFVVLVGLYLAVRDQPSTDLAAPTTIDAVAKMDRIEIVAPATAADAKPTLIVLEKPGDAWRLTRPIEADVSRRTADTLATLFAKEIRADDLELAGADPAQYNLDEASAVELSAYGNGHEAPALTLMVGKQVTVPETHVQRTYVQKPDDDAIYRAQVALGDFVRRPVSELRTKQVAPMEANAVTAVTVAHPGARDDTAGAPGQLRVAKPGAAWTMSLPQKAGPDQPDQLDQAKVAHWVDSLASIRAAGFARDVSAAEAGLERPKTTVTLHTDTAVYTLAIGSSAGAGKVYARFDDGSLFTLPKGRAQRLTPDPASLLDTGTSAQNDAPATPPNSPANPAASR